ncbi:MAG TPA: hypothetical protein VK747_02965 [Blastocatellia bacterium]|nr:hypothetical protein [Blastocatellia bacterium]
MNTDEHRSISGSGTGVIGVHLCSSVVTAGRYAWLFSPLEEAFYHSTRAGDEILNAMGRG